MSFRQTELLSSTDKNELIVVDFNIEDKLPSELWTADYKEREDNYRDINSRFSTVTHH